MGTLTARWRSILAVAALLVLGWSWSFASPVGSNADETFHLTSTWCAWGESETCLDGPSPGTVTVPVAVGAQACFVGFPERDAACHGDRPVEALVTTAHVNASGNYPPVFHLVMRAFVGDDVERSVVTMRMFNVALAAGMLLWALLLAPPVAARALALTWGVALVPFGLFNIASVNPSSWAIIGGGTCWAFLYTLFALPSWRSPRAAAAALGVMASALIAFARSDQAWVIVLSFIAVAILQRSFSRHTRRTLVAAAGALVVAAAVAALFSVGRYATSLQGLHWPHGSPLTDQPNPLLKVIAELPAYLGAHVGLQQPWAQREAMTDFGVEGWVNTAFLHGLGSNDITMPSIVGVVGLACVSALVFLGFSHYTRRKVAAVAVVLIGLIGQIIVMRSLAEWGSWTNTQGYAWFLYPRYTLPIVLLGIAVSLIVRPRTRPILNGLQATLISTAMIVSATVALLAVMARFMAGQDHSWTQFEVRGGWWWTWGPDPLVVIGIAVAAALIYFPAMISFGVSGARAPSPAAPRRAPQGASLPR